MAEQTSIWKKEIHLRRPRSERKPAAAALPPSRKHEPGGGWEVPKRTELWLEPEPALDPVEAIESEIDVVAPAAPLAEPELQEAAPKTNLGPIVAP